MLTYLLILALVEGYLGNEFGDIKPITKSEFIKLFNDPYEPLELEDIDSDDEDQQIIL